MSGPSEIVPDVACIASALIWQRVFVPLQHLVKTSCLAYAMDQWQGARNTWGLHSGASLRRF